MCKSGFKKINGNSHSAKVIVHSRNRYQLNNLYNADIGGMIVHHPDFSGNVEVKDAYGNDVSGKFVEYDPSTGIVGNDTPEGFTQWYMFDKPAAQNSSSYTFTYTVNPRYMVGTHDLKYELLTTEAAVTDLTFKTLVLRESQFTINPYIKAWAKLESFSRATGQGKAVFTYELTISEETALSHKRRALHCHYEKAAEDAVNIYDRRGELDVTGFSLSQNDGESFIRNTDFQLGYFDGNMASIYFDNVNTEQALNGTGDYTIGKLNTNKFTKLIIKIPIYFTANSIANGTATSATFTLSADFGVKHGAQSNEWTMVTPVAGASVTVGASIKLFDKQDSEHKDEKPTSWRYDKLAYPGYLRWAVEGYTANYRNNGYAEFRINWPKDENGIQTVSFDSIEEIKCTLDETDISWNPVPLEAMTGDALSYTDDIGGDGYFKLDLNATPELMNAKQIRIVFKGKINNWNNKETAYTLEAFDTIDPTDKHSQTQTITPVGGPVLPSTGGYGTHIFVIIGAIIIIFSATLIIAKK